MKSPALFQPLILFLLIMPLSAQEIEGPITPADTTHLVLPRNPTNRQPPMEINLAIEKFFVSLQREKIDEAFTELLSNSHHVQKKYNVEEFINKTKQALTVYGKLNGYELYDNRAIGSRVLYLTYFVYLDTIPLRWRFVYYSGDGESWKLINLSVDDLLDQSLLAE